MPPAPLSIRARTPGLVYTAASLIINNVPKLLHTVFHGGQDEPAAMTFHSIAKRGKPTNTMKAVDGVLIPVLVLLSGLFAGLTLGYMSLDETQLHVLSVSGKP